MIHLGPPQGSSSRDWDADHPGREQINDSLQYQSWRIDQALEEGKLTPDQASQFRKEISKIRQEEGTMAGLDHGHLTSAERKALNQQVAALGGQIGRATETPWQRHHQRRAEVDARLDHEKWRIRHELKEGDLTPGKARQLRKEVREVRLEERDMAGFNDGHITPAQQRELNWEENVISKQIG